MTALELPDCSDLRHAPELALLALIDSALLVATEALRLEYPGIEASQLRRVEHAPHVLLAFLLLERFRELRFLLANYHAVVRHDSDGLPF